MNELPDSLSYKAQTEIVIGAAYRVHNTLGAGFSEKVYENSLAIELKREGLQIEQQKNIAVFYQKQPVGNFVADIVINENIICEIKAVDTLIKQHEMQLVNYLVATDLDVGLLINFGKSVVVKRKSRKNPVNPLQSC
ncbi:MAG TPA: GxxExxY protein [Gammaproteobacteria bacterium]|nr:GxxExxY protein [Gammaproteobacteria bacterium]